MYIVFNELSVCGEICNCDQIDIARKTINDFIKILFKAKQHADFVGLITTQDIYNFQFSSNYSIKDWLSDPLVDMKLKTFYRIFCSQKCSYIEYTDYPLNEFLIEISKNKYNCIGCLVASEMKESVISLETHELWHNDMINGVFITLDNEIDKIISDNRQINNISKEVHFDNLEQKLKEDDFAMISSGQDLWEKRESIFPNLVFCNNVKDQLYKDPQRFHILQVAKKLLRIQQYFSEYDGVYNPKELGLDARTESDTVKSTPYLKALRQFEKPDGHTEYFYDHIGFTGHYCGRIHFLPDNENRKCYIGYVGKHLQTKKF
jgi:hypothetical protein